MRYDSGGEAPLESLPGFHCYKGKGRTLYVTGSRPVPPSEIDSESLNGFEERPAGAGFGGRGKVYGGELTAGSERIRAVLRQYRHGGFFPFPGRTLFLSPGRAKRELEGLTRLRREGLAVPEPLYLEIKRVKVFFFKMWLATGEIEGVVDLLGLFASRGEVGAKERRSLLRKVARVVCSMHEAGVSHRDLHAGNVLVGKGEGETEVRLVDFDGCRLGGPVSGRKRWKQILRFDRSLEKHYPRGLGFSKGERFRFLLYYARLSGDSKRSLKAKLIRHNLSLLWHGIWWKLFPARRDGLVSKGGS